MRVERWLLWGSFLAGSLTLLAAIALTTFKEHQHGVTLPPDDEPASIIQGLPSLLEGNTFNSQSLIRRLSSLLDEDEETPSLFPLTPLDYVGFTLTILGLVLAAGAGIGGMLASLSLR